MKTEGKREKEDIKKYYNKNTYKIVYLETTRDFNTSNRENSKYFRIKKKDTTCDVFLIFFYCDKNIIFIKII